ncbi:Ldh family oxidoreductase [Variovorax rhizosphaerae]|uniref:Ldh family oxidoreductase n=1 Tax=Variovorax rhizosphaerae TaxID=1836200 RepID=A0ABU8WJS3_9BURK
MGQAHSRSGDQGAMNNFLEVRLDAAEVLAKAEALLCGAGLEKERAAAVARRLVEADLLGHRTHGLQQLVVYLERLGDGRIATSGEIEVLSDSGASFSWTCGRLPGAWAMERLISRALERSAQHPVVTATLSNCSHIGALQAYLEDIADHKLLALLMVTDPGVASMAPPGGIDAVTTSNPIAACIPTHGDPILIDQTTTLVSNGAIAQHAAQGTLLPGNWVRDNQGRASNDPHVMSANPPGTLMPLGGEDFGYKGFAFSLFVEAFALALSGFGRDQPRVRGAQGVFLQVIDPAHFGLGKAGFLAATTALVDQCKSARPATEGNGVRLPGERALKGKKAQLADGIVYSQDLLKVLDAWAARLGIDVRLVP